MVIVIPYKNIIFVARLVRNLYNLNVIRVGRKSLRNKRQIGLRNNNRGLPVRFYIKIELKSLKYGL